MATQLDDLDHRLIALLKVNARLPLTRIAQALQCARSTAQLRLKALEDSGVITGYTLSTGSLSDHHSIQALVMLEVTPEEEGIALKAMAKLHQIYKIYSVSGRYDFCLMLSVDTTEELEMVVDRLRHIKGVRTAFSHVLLSKKLDRPEN